MLVFNPPPYVLKALDVLKRGGARGWLVGGCVRDALLGRTPNDFDIAVDVPPRRTMEIFNAEEGCFTVPTGLKHGTVTVHIDGRDLELTTLRRDGDYLDSRHPSSVTFVTDLESDLARRDFTINAAAWSPDDGLCDPFGAEEDARAGVIRCVGSPEKRFGEDALRIMRALRFASVLGFEVEPATAGAVRAMYPRLADVSRERIRQELLKLIRGKGAVDVMLGFREVVLHVIPEFRPCVGYDPGVRHKYDIYEHCVRTMGALDLSLLTVRGAPYRAAVMMAALLHDVGKPECRAVGQDGRVRFPRHEYAGARIAGEVMRRLRFDNHTVAMTRQIIARHDSYPRPNRNAVRRDIAEAGGELWWSIEALRRADNSAKAEDAYEGGGDYFETVEAIARGIFRDGDCVRPAMLDVSGGDLMGLGVSGVVLGDVKRALFDEVVDGRIENSKPLLLERARELIDAGNSPATDQSERE